jgi:phage terminase large subunit
VSSRLIIRLVASNNNDVFKQFTTLQTDYVYNPKKWAYDILKFEPDKWQEEVLDAYTQNRFIALSTGNGVGKSALLAVLILHFLSTRPFPKIPCTAPSQHQLFDILWAEISKWLRRSELLSRVFKWTQTKVALRGHEEEWFAVARTSKPEPGKPTAEGLQGFHADHLLFVVDEASGVADQIMGAAMGALTNTNARVMLASNPTRRSGQFFKIINMKLEGRDPQPWWVKFVSCLDAKYVAKEFIDNITTTYGKDSDNFRFRVLGIPPRAEAAALISPEQMFEAHARPVDETGKTVLSCDPARYGDDDSVWYLRKGLTFRERHCFHGLNTVQATKIGLDLFEAHEPDIYNIDEIGLGAGIYDYTKKALRHIGSKVKGINVGEKARDEVSYYNLRAELYMETRQMIDVVSIPIITDLLDEELTTIKYGWDSKDKRIKIQSKDDIKKELRRSPNDADSFVLNNAATLVSQLKAAGYFKHTIQANTRSKESVANNNLTMFDIGRSRRSPRPVGSRRYGPIGSRISFFDRHAKGM